MESTFPSKLFGNPTAISEEMPGVFSRFVDIDTGMAVGAYRGDRKRSIQTNMTNDINGVIFSCLLAGRVERSTCRRSIIPDIGGGHIGYTPNEHFLIKASSTFRQVELLVSLERLIEIAGDEADWLLADVSHGRSVLQDSAPTPQTMAAALALAERVEHHGTSPLMIKAAAIEFLAWQVGNPLSSQEDIDVPPRERKRLLIARDRLLMDLSAPPTIAELARESGLNQLKLKRGFKILFGTSVYALFLRERMKRARQLLRDHNVGETAHLLGYSNVSHFSRAFYRQFGVLPGQARKDAV